MDYCDFSSVDLIKKFGNEVEGNTIDTLYGCSTTGIEWRFLRYENQEVTIDEERYLLTNSPKLLGVLQRIIERSKEAVAVNT